MRTLRFILVICLAAAGAGIAAAKNPPKPDPSQVPGSMARQALLKGALDKHLSGTLVAELNQNKKIWNSLPPEELRQLRQRYYAFLKQDPSRQADLVQAAIQFEKLTEEQKRIYQERAEWLNRVVASLTPQQREELQRMNPQERAQRLYELRSALPSTQPAAEPATQPDSPKAD